MEVNVDVWRPHVSEILFLSGIIYQCTVLWAACVAALYSGISLPLIKGISFVDETFKLIFVCTFAFS